MELFYISNGLVVSVWSMDWETCRRCSLSAIVKNSQIWVAEVLTGSLTEKKNCSVSAMADSIE